MEEVKKYGIASAQMNMLINDVRIKMLYTQYSNNTKWFKLIYIQTVDVSVFGVVQSISKFLLVDMTVPVMIQPFRLVVPFPKEESRLFAMIRPFQPMV